MFVFLRRGWGLYRVYIGFIGFRVFIGFSRVSAIYRYIYIYIYKS